MKIAICDDSERDSLFIRDLCFECSNEFENEVLIFKDGESLCDAYEKGNIFDLVILDVDMPGKNGIETGKVIRNIDKNVIIIFVTAYPQYALEAFECEAFHYLLKPCTAEKMSSVLERVSEKKKLSCQYHVVKVKKKIVRIPIADIYYIESFRKHVIYHTSVRDIDTVGNLSVAYETLKNYNFLQVHQGYIVNMEKIFDFEHSAVILDDGRRVMMSMRRKREVMLAYAKYAEKKI